MENVQWPFVHRVAAFSLLILPCWPRNGLAGVFFVSSDGISEADAPSVGGKEERSMARVERSCYSLGTKMSRRPLHDMTRRQPAGFTFSRSHLQLRIADINISFQERDFVRIPPGLHRQAGDRVANPGICPERADSAKKLSTPARRCQKLGNQIQTACQDSQGNFEPLR
ncbi:hypothetical protein BKA80DRAFT_77573 [Phyllosticta citrichinensis]